MMKQQLRAGSVKLESWPEGDGTGGADFWVFRHPNGEAVTLAFFDYRRTGRGHSAVAWAR